MNNFQEYGVRWSEFGRGDRLNVKEKFFRNEKQLQAFIEKLADKPNFHEILAYTNPTTEENE